MQGIIRGRALRSSRRCFDALPNALSMPAMLPSRSHISWQCLMGCIVSANLVAVVSDTPTASSENSKLRRACGICMRP